MGGRLGGCVTTSRWLGSFPVGGRYETFEKSTVEYTSGH